MFTRLRAKLRRLNLPKTGHPGGFRAVPSPLDKGRERGNGKPRWGRVTSPTSLLGPVGLEATKDAFGADEAGPYGTPCRAWEVVPDMMAPTFHAGHGAPKGRPALRRRAA